jgi:hypothetical protein
VEEKGSEASFNALSCCCQSQFLAIKRLEEVGLDRARARYDSQ